jgi:hypothetical protein
MQNDPVLPTRPPMPDFRVDELIAQLPVIGSVVVAMGLLDAETAQALVIGFGAALSGVWTIASVLLRRKRNESYQAEVAAKAQVAAAAEYAAAAAAASAPGAVR